MGAAYLIDSGVLSVRLGAAHSHILAYSLYFWVHTLVDSGVLLVHLDILCWYLEAVCVPAGEEESWRTHQLLTMKKQSLLVPRVSERSSNSQ